MSTFNLKKPMLKDNNWLIFQDSIFNNLSVMDCNDTVEGICYTDKTFDQCIQSCKDNASCGAGYYIKGLGKNICVPLRTTIYRDVNPIYRLRNQSIYPELDNMDVKTFIDKDTFYFPPVEANTVFFMDHLLITNVDDSLTLQTSPLSYDFNDAKFEKDGSLIVQLLPIRANITVGTNYKHVNYGEPFAINIPGTSLVLRQSRSKKHMTWIPRRDSLTLSDSFSISPIMPDKKMGDPISYSDTFSIKYSDIDTISVSDSLHFTSIYYGSYKDAKSRGHSVTFKFIPKMKGYYCADDGSCTEMNLEDMVVNKKGIGTYNGLDVGRNPGCWGVCKYKVKGFNKIKPFDIYQTDIYSKLKYTWILIVISILISIGVSFGSESP